MQFYDEFFSYNRLFYEQLTKPSGQHSLLSISSFLNYSLSSFRDKLLSFGLPTRMSRLISIAKSANVNSDPPKIYGLLKDAIENDKPLNSLYIEHFRPLRPFHFDYLRLLGKYSTYSLIPEFIDENIYKLDYRNYFMGNNSGSFIQEVEDFNKKMEEMFTNIPDLFISLDGDQRYLINSHLSIAFLYGNVKIEHGGIGSPHLHGTFSLSSRKEGTGYLNLDSILNSHKKPDMDKFNSILNWLKINNPLYSEIAPLDVDFFRTKIDPAFSPNNDVIGVAELPIGNEQIQQNNNVDYSKIPIILPNSSGKSETIYVDVEKALLLCFPMIFPFGNMPTIPGKTLRQKAAVLFGSHYFFRCGRLQCSMILFLYNAIMAKKASFLNSKINNQRINIPNGASRLIPSVTKIQNDPSSPLYWYHKQSHVRGMCAYLGDPDLMVTFTFVNKWPEVKNVESIVNGIGYDNLDIRFCPFEEMLIWKQRFKEIKKNGFNFLIKNMNFGEVTNYCWRLEFQARGAPHVHALIWLKDRLTLENVSQNFFASLPPSITPKLSELVSSNMIHECKLVRCKKGDETAACKYGFPKQACNNIHIDENGNIVLPRNDNEKRVVEYSPYFLLTWGGHCHVHILRNSIHSECSANAIHYIVKYNFKAEPNLRIQIERANDSDSNPYQTSFHARIVSVEEAAAKIVPTKFFGSSMAATYLTLKPPENRQAAFRDGVQVQITSIDKYFNRPRDLERIGILDYFSFYDIVPTEYTNGQYIHEIENERNPDEAALILNKPNRTGRPCNSLAEGSKWEEENLNPLVLINSDFLFPDKNLPNSKALKVEKRAKPQIILTERFSITSNINEFCFLKTLLAGCWRSDEEIKSQQENWHKSMEYHGLSIPEEDYIYQYYKNLIIYMLESPRYNTYDFITSISMMNYDMFPFLNALLNKVSIENRNKIDHALNYIRSIDSINIDSISDISNEPSDFQINKFICYSFNDEELIRSLSDLRIFEEKFNDGQRFIFNEVRNRLLAGQQLTAFIKGKAGTGKSFLIKSIINLLKVQKIPFVVCATTGIAASLIGGKTVHSTFGLYSVKRNSMEEVVCSLDVSKPNGLALTYVKVIIIDEVTMMSAKVLSALEYGIRKIMAQVKSPFGVTPFGGKCVLLFGDLAQVPAVTRAPDDFLESLQQFHESATYTGFIQWELKTLMRQSEDEIVFIRLLENIRQHKDGEPLDSEVEAELKRIFHPGKIDELLETIDFFVGGDNPNGMVITFTNQHAQMYNMLKLEKRNSIFNCSNIKIDAQFFVRQQNYYVGNPNCPPDEARRRQLAISNTRAATQSEIRIFCGAMKKREYNSIIPFQLVISIGARVMLLQNLDVERHLINGSRGYVVRYDEKLDALFIHFDIQGDNENPVMITRTKSTEYQINNGKVIFMYQFPIKLAWAVTAHKSQGQTLEKCAIDIGEKAFAHGSLYVALSRVKSLNNVMLFGLDKWPEGGPAFHVNPYIQAKQNEQAANEFE